METFKLLLDFLGSHLWEIILLTLILTNRNGIEKLFERLTKLNFSLGNATGTFEAASPYKNPDHPIQLPIEPNEPPERASEPEANISKEKEENSDWFSKVHEAFDKKDIDGAHRLFQEHQNRVSDKNKKYENEAFFLYFLFKNGGDRTALEKAEKLYKNHENDDQLNSASVALSFIYDDIKDHEKEKDLWRECIKTTQDPSLSIKFKVNLARALEKSGNPEEGLELLLTELKGTHKNHETSEIYRTIAELSKSTNDSYGRALALEKSVEYDHGNPDKLFDAAYAQSDEDLNKISIENYLTLLNLDPNHPTALNNLGVCAGKENLKGIQIKYFKEAASKNSTLAMANLANLYIEGGFFDDAKEILEKAIKLEDPHENVGHSLYTLKTTSAKTDDDWKKIVRQAKDFQRTIRLYSEAYFDNSINPTSWESYWKTENSEKIESTTHDQMFTAKWETLDNTSENETTIKHSIYGKITNRSARLTYTKKLETSKKPSLLYSPKNTSVQCIAFLSKDGTSLSLFSAADNQKIITLQLQDTNKSK